MVYNLCNKYSLAPPPLPPLPQLSHIHPLFLLSLSSVFPRSLHITHSHKSSPSKLNTLVSFRLILFWPWKAGPHRICASAPLLSLQHVGRPCLSHIVRWIIRCIVRCAVRLWPCVSTLLLFFLPACLLLSNNLLKSAEACFPLLVCLENGKMQERCHWVE